MGKVQEAINRLSRKTRPKLNLSARLRIPAQQEHQSSLFPAEPSQVKSWLIAHGAFNTSASVKTLTRALQHSNRTINSPSQRLLIMEHFEKPFDHALQSLDSRYLYLDFPMPDDAENAFQMAAILCQEMAYGYKVALVDTIQGRGKLNTKQKQFAVSRALQHLTRTALRHSQIYRDWPKDIWTDINTLMWLAKYDHTEAKPTLQIKETDQNNDKTLSIANLYARLCALSTLNNNRYQPLQLKGLFVSLSKHCSEVEFSNKPPVEGKTAAHVYCAGESNPPKQAQFCRYQNADNLLYFSLEPLLAKLTHSVEETTGIEPGEIITNRIRTDARAPRASVITARTGLKEIYTAIRSAPPTDQIESQFTDLSELISSSTPLTRSVENDILNSVNLTEGGTEFLVDNQSENGLGLSLSGKAACHIQVGELIAHCYKNQSEEVSWHFALVCWLSTTNDKTLKLGVETITKHGNAVDVYRLIKGSDRSDAPVEGLLANCQLIDAKAKMLLLPKHQFKPGETVGYRDSTGFNIVKLIESVNLNACFQCFAIISVSDDDTALAEKLTSNPAPQAYSIT